MAAVSSAERSILVVWFSIQAGSIQACPPNVKDECPVRLAVACMGENKGAVRLSFIIYFDLDIS